MRCAAALLTYSCSNATGTTCTKVAVTIPAINANVTCGAAELVVLTKPEYDTINTNVSAATTGNTTQTGQIGTLEGQLAATTASLNAVIAASGGGGGSTPNPDVLAAQSILFGVTFGALCVIWGLKRLYNLFRTADHE